MNTPFLIDFREELRRHYAHYRFVVICGGGPIARKYMDALRSIHRSEYEQALAGIRATRMNARFLMQFFGKEANDKLPSTMQQVKNNLAKNNVVICGALRYEPDSTSDGTAARLAQYLKTSFINMTNTSGLYSADPKKNRDAKLIPHISWAKFEELVNKIKYIPGQHFVLDQKAAGIIGRRRISTHIVGPDCQQLARILHNKPYKGTLIQG
jgi:uridylate kinase